MKRAITIILTVMALLLLPSITQGNETPTHRIAGNDRFETAVLISRINYPDGADKVYIANGITRVDALAASSFDDGPILLVTKDSVPMVTLSEVRRLDPVQIVVLGGTDAISESVEDELNGGPQALSYNEYMLELINSERNSALYESSDIQSVAHDWSQTMSSERRMYHNPNLADEVCCWQTLAENVGFRTMQDNTPDDVYRALDSLHSGFMGSEHHRENIVNPIYDDIGLGIVISDRCPSDLSHPYCIWVTQNFRQLA